MTDIGKVKQADAELKDLDDIFSTNAGVVGDADPVPRPPPQLDQQPDAPKGFPTEFVEPPKDSSYLVKGALWKAMKANPLKGKASSSLGQPEAEGQTKAIDRLKMEHSKILESINRMEAINHDPEPTDSAHAIVTLGPHQLLQNWLLRAEAVHRDHMMQIRQHVLDDWSKSLSTSGSVANKPMTTTSSENSSMCTSDSLASKSVISSEKATPRLLWPNLTNAVVPLQVPETPSTPLAQVPEFPSTPLAVAPLSSPASKFGSEAGSSKSPTAAVQKGLALPSSSSGNGVAQKSGWGAVKSVVAVNRLSRHSSTVSTAVHFKRRGTCESASVSSLGIPWTEEDTATSILTVAGTKGVAKKTLKKIVSAFVYDPQPAHLKTVGAPERKALEASFGKFIFSRGTYFLKLFLSIVNMFFVVAETAARLAALDTMDGTEHRTERIWFWGEVVCWLVFSLDAIGTLTFLFWVNRSQTGDRFQGVVFWYIVIAVICAFGPTYFIFNVLPNVQFFRIVPILLNLRLSRSSWLEQTAWHIETMFRVILQSLPNLALTLSCFFIILGFIGAAFSFFLYRNLHGSGVVIPDEFQYYFGTYFRTLRSLFMAVTGGDDWGNMLNALSAASDYLSFVFVIYIAFMVIGLLNIITGLFVDQAMAIASSSRNQRVREKTEEEKKIVQELEEIFKQCDDDGSGTLTKEEFSKLLHDERVSTFLSTLGLEFSEVETLFQILDQDKTEEVSIDDFTWGCIRLKGGATSMDLCTLLYEHRTHSKTQLKAIEEIIEDVQCIGEVLDKVASSMSISTPKKRSASSSCLQPNMSGTPPGAKTGSGSSSQSNVPETPPGVAQSIAAAANCLSQYNANQTESLSRAAKCFMMPQKPKAAEHIAKEHAETVEPVRGIQQTKAKELGLQSSVCDVATEDELRVISVAEQLQSSSVDALAHSNAESAKVSKEETHPVRLSGVQDKLDRMRRVSRDSFSLINTVEDVEDEGEASINQGARTELDLNASEASDKVLS